MNETELLQLVPQVLRARDFHLYTEGGKRLVDLWQEGGTAVLGHTPPNQLHELKNAASRGLFSALPHPQEKRFNKALSQLFPGKVIRVYAHPVTLKDLSIENEKNAAALWRPFLDTENPLALVAANAGKTKSPPVLIPVLPGQLGGIPFVLAIDPQFAETHPFPPSGLISPALLALAVRGVYDLIAAAPERGKLRYHKIDSALKKNAEPADLGSVDHSPIDPKPVVRWRRRGIYLFPQSSGNSTCINLSDWKKVFLRFLEGGFLIPPNPDSPLILPGILSPGEEAKLADLLGGVVL
jgi:hypothetical protein